MSVKPRIAFFITSLAGGGAERVVLSLARGFWARGYAVDLLITKKGGELEKEVWPDIPLRALGPNFPCALFNLWRYMRRNSKTVLVTALPVPSLAALLVRPFCGGKGRTIITQHKSISMDRALVPGLKGQIRIALLKKLYRFADRTVCVSKGVADDHAEQTGMARDKIDVIYNPVVESGMLAKAEENPDHPFLAPGRNFKTVLAAGRFDRVKDYGTLIHAFALLQARVDARLLIIGEGPEREKLEKLVQELGIQDKADLPGFQLNPYAFIHAADIFAVSSRFEGFGNVIVEALALGTPVVSTDCPAGPEEILEGGKWGRLVPVGDAQALADALADTLDAERQPDMSRRAEAFTARASLDAYENLIRDMTGG